MDASNFGLFMTIVVLVLSAAVIVYDLTTIKRQSNEAAEPVIHVWYEQEINNEDGRIFESEFSPEDGMPEYCGPIYTRIYLGTLE